MLYPFFAMINLSFVPNGEIFNQGGKLLYSPLTTENYFNVFEKIPLWKYFANSLFVALVTTAGQVLFSAFAGYAFARMNFKFRDGIFVIILITMLAPPQVNIVPLFFIMLTRSAKDGASNVLGKDRGFPQKTVSKKWQGGHFLRAFRGSGFRLHCLTATASPPLQSRPWLFLLPILFSILL